MAIDYKQLGMDVFEAVGGNENITAMVHCATRLRFSLRDHSIVDRERLDNMKGVLRCVEGNGQFQVVIGPSVPVAYQAAMTLFKGANASAGNAAPEKEQTLGAKFLAVLGGIFAPVLPAITAAGMLKAVLALLKVSGLMAADSEFITILTFASDAAFYFMPFILAASCANLVHMSSGLAMMLAGIMLHPTFVGFVSSGTAISFLGIPIRLVPYSSSVIPIILVVFVASYVEQFANKILPDVIKFIMRPLIVVLVMIPLSLCVLGPIGAYIGDGLAAVVNAIDSIAPWAVPTLMGAFTPILVMFGVHGGLLPIATAQLTTQGYETIFGPGMLASNIAQGACSLAVAVRTKNPELKQTAVSAGFTALMGITEPAMYGVTLRNKKLLYCVIAGGGVAGLVAGLSGLVRYSFGNPGLATLPVFIGENPSNIIKALIVTALSFVVTFVLCLFVKVDEAEKKN